MRVDGELVLKLRTARGWSQEDLARATGLNLRTVQRIENTAIASLRSKSALAAALDVDIEELDPKELGMSPCPECRSDEVYQYNDLVDSTTIGGELLPRLSTRRLSSARMRPVVCANCGFLRYFVEDAARQKMTSSGHWRRV